MIRVAVEGPEDRWDIEYLLDTAFVPGRTALSSYRLREGVAPIGALCLTARDEGAMDSLAGAIRFWPVRIGEGGLPALLLGPVATHPTRQGEGIGGMLIGEGLSRAQALGWLRVILVGDEPYYGRFGFSRKLAEALSFPPPTNPARILARELAPEGMIGISGEVRRWNEPAAS